MQPRLDQRLLSPQHSDTVAQCLKTVPHTAQAGCQPPVDLISGSSGFYTPIPAASSVSCFQLCSVFSRVTGNVGVFLAENGWRTRVPAVPITRSGSDGREVSLLLQETLQGPITDPCQYPSSTLGVRTAWASVFLKIPQVILNALATTRNHPYPCHNREIQGAYEKSLMGINWSLSVFGGGMGIVFLDCMKRIK